MIRNIADRRGRVRLRWLAILFVVLAVTIFAAPYLFSFDPFRKLVLRAALPNVNGRISAGDAHFGWLTPLSIEDLQIRATDGEPVISVAYFGTDRTLWQLLTDRQHLGNIRVETPQVHIFSTSTTNSLAETFPQAHEQLRGKPGPPSDAWKQLSVHVAVTNASVSWRAPDNSRTWGVDHVPFSVGIEPADPAAGKKAEIVIDPVTVFDHREISPGMCNDLLKYVAPVLANVATAQGEVSLQLDGGHFPADDPKLGTLSGRLTLHAVEVGAGPLAQVVAKVLKVPQTVSLARENVVEFKLTDGRVYHEGLQFGVDQLQVRTHGSVGLDQTLDLVAEVQLHLSDTTTGGRPILKALSNQMLRIPVKGTLNHPEVDPGALAQTSLGIVIDALTKARREIKPEPELTTGPDLGPGPSLGAANDPSPAPAPEGAMPNELSLDTLEQLRASGVLVPQGAPEVLPAPPGQGPPVQTPGSQPPFVQQPNAQPPGTVAQTPSTLDDIKATAIDVMAELLRRRQQRMAQEAAQRAAAPAPASVTPPPGTAQNPAPQQPVQPPPPQQPPLLRRGGLIGRAVDRIRAATEPTPDAAPAPNP
jgi:hypothetical protein